MPTRRDHVFRWLVPLAYLLSCIPCAFGQTEAASSPSGIAPAGHLVTNAVDSSEGSRLRVAPYQPQPGDVVLFDDFNPLFHFIYRLALTSPPTHAAIIIAREDGTPAVLDLVGPSVLRARVSVIDIEPRFSSYPGTIMVRRVQQPLTPEQSAELTRFARAQEGKHFAAERVVLQATPFRARVGLRHQCFARTHFDRNRWFCSELVIAAACTAKILDPAQYPANAIYPHDLAYDEWVNLSHRYQPPLPWVADPRVVTATAAEGPSVIAIEHADKR
jgi:hypothetical protein